MKTNIEILMEKARAEFNAQHPAGGLKGFAWFTADGELVSAEDNGKCRVRKDYFRAGTLRVGRADVFDYEIFFGGTMVRIDAPNVPRYPLFNDKGFRFLGVVSPPK